MAEGEITISVRAFERVALGVMLAVLLLLGVAAVEGEPAAAEERELRCLTADRIEDVRGDPETFSGVADVCRSEVAAAIGGGWSDGAVEAVTAAMVAHRMAPYGPSEHRDDLTELMAEPTLHCGTYAEIGGRLADYPGVSVIGFAGGDLVGNHSQLIYDDDDRQLLIDPTIGVTAEIDSVDALLSGEPASQIVDMGVWRDDAHLDGFRSNVIRALREGLYQPTYLMFLYESADQFSQEWWDRDVMAALPTPGAAIWRLTNT